LKETLSVSENKRDGTNFFFFSSISFLLNIGYPAVAWKWLWERKKKEKVFDDLVE